MNNMPLLWSYDSIYEFRPPVETGGYKYFAPTERDAEAMMVETERAALPGPIRQAQGKLNAGTLNV